MVIEFKENHYGERLFPCVFLENNTPTNGDIIKALFPNCIKDSNFCGAVITHLNGEPQYWSKDWWNAPYKRGDVNDD